MKQIFTTLIALFSFALAYAQVPQSMSYQAIARDSAGNCLKNETISLQISILSGAPDGTIIYQERFEGNVQTNDAGHFQVAIGTGNPQSAGQTLDFDTINWNNQTLFLKVEYAPGNTTGFVHVGTTQLLTVPYAMVAGNGKLYSNGNKDEKMFFYGTNGSTNVIIGGASYQGNQIFNDGAITLRDGLGDAIVELRSSPSDIIGNSYGLIQTRGYNNSINTGLTYRNISCPNNGSVRVFDENSTPKAALEVNCDGSAWIWADGANGGVKSFRMPHPTKTDKQIVYACIEGPEAAAYERGTVMLVNGEAEVLFSETFEIVANPNTMTVMTTPWSAESKGLAVVERTEKGFRIKELGGGTGSYKVDWEAKAVRKGWEDFEVVRDKDKVEESGISESAEKED